MKLQFHNLTHRFGKQTVFRDLEADFQAGKIIALLGPSGCGKSTLLRIFAGLEPVQEGKLQLSPELSQKISMVFQESQLLPWRTAKENAELPTEIQGKDSPANSIKAIFSSLGLEGAEGKYPRELSGGMKMRVALARALVQEPHLLLMDEPFSALDETTRESLQILTRKLNLENPHRLTVFVTHSISEALFLADEIYVMQAGGGWKLKMINPSPAVRSLEFLNSKEFFEIKREWIPRLREVFQ